MAAMLVISTLTWLPLGITPLALMMLHRADAAANVGGRWLLVAAVVAQSSVVSAPLMFVAGGRNLRRNAIAFILCKKQKVCSR